MLSKAIMKILIVLLCLSIGAFATPVSCLDSSVANTNVLGAPLAAGCSLGGLTFDRFTANFAPAPGGIFLSSVGTGALAGEVDLGFQIALALPPSDALFWYRIISPDSNIVGIDNAHNGTGQTAISEVACAVEPIGGICPSQAVLGSFANPPNTSVFFAPHSSVWVIKDIGTPFAGDSVSFFVNSTHMTTVPEPGAMLLIGAGLAGLAVIRKRKQ